MKRLLCGWCRLLDRSQALWFILRGDLLYVFPCVILFLCFSVLLVLRLPRLGKRELILVLFVRLFGLCLFRFVGFLFLLGCGKGCGLWLWHSLDWTFLLPFLFSIYKRLRMFYVRKVMSVTSCLLSCTLKPLWKWVIHKCSRIYLLFSCMLQEI